MKKNVAGQVIGAQMVSATDGSAFTGAVTVKVCGDAGTQATGSVGSGACTHEGSGYHTYAPAQAETNYDLIAFTFTGTGAVPVTVQMFTDYPQTGDAFARLGAPAGASVSADVAQIYGAVDTEVGAIKTKTDNLPADTATTLSNMQSDVTAIKGYVDTEVAAIKAKTDNLPADTSASLTTLQSDVTDIKGYVDTEVAAIKAKTDNLPSDTATVLAALASQASVDTIDSNVDAIKAKTDNLPADTATTLGTLASQSSVDTIDSNVDSIKAKTDNLPSDPADASDIADAFGAVGSAIGALHNFDPATDTVMANLTEIGGSSDAASNLKAGALSIIQGTAVTGSLGTTAFTTNLDATVTVDNALKGRVIIFAGGTANARVARTIMDYDEATGTITVDTALPVTPVNADAFVIV